MTCKTLKAFALFSLLLFCTADIIGQTSPTSDAAAAPSSTTTISPEQTSIENAPPTVTYNTKPSGSRFLASDEFGLSLLVLIFGVVVFLLQFFLIWQKLFSPNQSLRAMTITLVIISSLFVISAGFTSDQITPITGLLGTIVGYLLGSNQSTTEKTD